MQDILNLIKKNLDSGDSITLSRMKAVKELGLPRNYEIVVQKDPSYLEILNEYMNVKGKRKQFVKDKTTRIKYKSQVVINGSLPVGKMNFYAK